MKVWTTTGCVHSLPTRLAKEESRSLASSLPPVCGGIMGAWVWAGNVGFNRSPRESNPVRKTRERQRFRRAVKYWVLEAEGTEQKKCFVFVFWQKACRRANRQGASSRRSVSSTVEQGYTVLSQKNRDLNECERFRHVPRRIIRLLQNRLSLPLYTTIHIQNIKFSCIICIIFTVPSGDTQKRMHCLYVWLSDSSQDFLLIFLIAIVASGLFINNLHPYF